MLTSKWIDLPLLLTEILLIFQGTIIFFKLILIHIFEINLSSSIFINLRNKENGSVNLEVSRDISKARDNHEKFIFIT